MPEQHFSAASKWQKLILRKRGRAFQLSPSYTYDNNNRLISSSQGGVATRYTYAADGTGRLTQMLTKNGTASVVTTNIGYVDSSTTSTTAQVKTWNVDAPETAVNKMYFSAYDSHGASLTQSKKQQFQFAT